MSCAFEIGFLFNFGSSKSGVANFAPESACIPSVLRMIGECCYHGSKSFSVFGFSFCVRGGYVELKVLENILDSVSLSPR